MKDMIRKYGTSIGLVVFVFTSTLSGTRNLLAALSLDSLIGTTGGNYKDCPRTIQLINADKPEEGYKCDDATLGKECRELISGHEKFGKCENISTAPSTGDPAVQDPDAARKKRKYKGGCYCKIAPPTPTTGTKSGTAPTKGTE